MNSLISVIESKQFISKIYNTYRLYITHGARSSKKVDYFHGILKTELEKLFHNSETYNVVLEYDVPSCNSTGKKKCDVVVIRNGKPYIVFPVKIIMTNYKQNKNNSWENLTGELIHLKWKNPDLHIIPVNIFMNNTPYLKSNKKICRFEKIKFIDIENYNVLLEKNICFDMINYIIDVKHVCEIDDEFNTLPQIIGFTKETPYRQFSQILHELI
jgi:hypothetical protein